VPASVPNRTTVLAETVAFEEPQLDTSISIVLDERGAIPSANQLGIADKDTMSGVLPQRKSITRRVDVKYIRFEKE
jgi:hypothetical protein